MGIKISKIRTYYCLFSGQKNGLGTSKRLWEFFFIQAQIPKVAIALLVLASKKSKKTGLTRPNLSRLSNFEKLIH
jgi:hypothetical protein